VDDRYRARRDRGKPMSDQRNKPAVSMAEIKPELERLHRRGFLRSTLSLGALTMVTGYELSTQSGVDGAPEAMPDNWVLSLGGLVADRRPWTLQKLMALPQQGQITRHICIEGWSQIGQWSGVPLGTFLRRVGADLSARYVYFKCFDGYSTSIDMASALQPQTILALDFEEKPLAPQWGAPLRLRIPTKLGFKSAKNLEAIEVTNKYPGGYWENQGYDWFAGV